MKKPQSNERTGAGGIDSYELIRYPEIIPPKQAQNQEGASPRIRRTTELPMQTERATRRPLE